MRRAVKDHLDALDHWIRNKTFNMDLATPARACLRECSYAFNDIEQISTMEVDLATYVHGVKRQALHSKLRDAFLHMDIVEVDTRAHIGTIMDCHGVPVDIPEAVALRDKSWLHTFTLINAVEA